MLEARRRRIWFCAVVFSVMFTRVVRSQCQLPELTSSDVEAGDGFGSEMSINGDVLAIGAVNDDEGTGAGAIPNTGSVYIFRRNGVTWEEEARLITLDPDPGDELGVSVALDQNVLIAGASRDDDGTAFNAGAAYIFTRDANGWSQTTKLQEPGGGDGSDFFGFSVDISANVAIVGAYRDDAAGLDAGAAYVFRRNGSEWSHEQTLLASDAAPGDRFGISVSIDGTTAAVGAYWSDDAGDRSGSVYIFESQGGSWVERVKLRASDETDNEQFGRSVALQGSRLVVGADKANVSDVADAGAAYVFVGAGAVWSETQKLTASGGAASDEMGRAVAIDGNLIVAGAPGRNAPGQPPTLDTGAAYLFRESGGFWMQDQFLGAPVVDAEAEMGRSVALSGGWGLVGARGADLPGGLDDAGVAYVFWVNGTPDCDANGAADVCDVASGNVDDCDANAVPDLCEPDCDENGVADACDLLNGAEDCDDNGILDVCQPDCNGNQTNDFCEILDGTAEDCNSNGVPDLCDLAAGTSEDCNGDSVPNECEFDCDFNGMPDECELASGAPDCNANSILDVCETDCNGNDVPDDCDLMSGGSDDCNLNATPDECDVLSGFSSDCNSNLVPDECEEDCNGSGAPDDCDIAAGTSADCNGNGLPDECEKGAGQDCNLNTIPDECEPDCNGNNRPDDCDLVDGTSPDCNSNNLPDECDISLGVSLDCDANGVPDECDPDCNANGAPDACDILSGQSSDCDVNGVPDECEIASDPDCNGNGTLDVCETDCNGNSIPDDCDLLVGTSPDCNNTGIPDECDIGSGLSGDCNGNLIPDECDVALGGSDDCNGDEIPDECASLPLVLRSIPLSPIGAGVPQTFIVSEAVFAAGLVEVTLEARADLESPAETLEVFLNGVSMGIAFIDGANDCPETMDVDSVAIDPIVYNDLVANIGAVITVVASDAVDPTPILCDSTLVIQVSYQELFNSDCNLNNIPDNCEIAAGLSPDCNENGVPDECDIIAGISEDMGGDGIPDECQADGDADGDGNVDLKDYEFFMACFTGPGGGIFDDTCLVFDFDLDQDVDLSDFGGLQTRFTGE